MGIIAQATAFGKRALQRVPESVLMALIVILASSGSFGLGMLAAREEGTGNIWIEERPLEAYLPGEVGQAAVAAAVEKTPEPALNAGGQYVASKNGEKYYLPWCGGVSRIKEENKVWFASKAEAEAAGYTPAANCKGI